MARSALPAEPQRARQVAEALSRRELGEVEDRLRLLTANCPSQHTLRRWQSWPSTIPASFIDVLERACELTDTHKGATGSLGKPKSSTIWVDSLGTVEEWSLAEFSACGVQPEEIADQLISLDIALWPETLSNENVGSRSQWGAICAQLPELWRAMVILDGTAVKIVGYWMFVSPNDYWFGQACIGEYPEALITSETLEPVGKGPLNLYGPALFTIPGLRPQARKLLGAKMIASMISSLDELSSSGVVIDRVCSQVLSEEGRSIAEKRFHLEPMPDSISDRYAKLMDWPRSGKRTPKLPALYYGHVGSPGQDDRK